MSGKRAKGRRIPRSELADYRRRALEMRAQEMPPRKIAQVLGCGRSTVFGWFKEQDAGQMELEPKPLPGAKPRLADRQVARLRAMLFKDPRQLEFDFGLWTRKMVKELIERKFGVRMSVSAVGAMLRHRMGMSPQRPLHRAAQQDPEAVRRWKQEEYPAIVAQARKEHAQIWFQDESSVSTLR